MVAIMLRLSVDWLQFLAINYFFQLMQSTNSMTFMDRIFLPEALAKIIYAFLKPDPVLYIAQILNFVASNPRRIIPTSTTITTSDLATDIFRYFLSVRENYRFSSSATIVFKQHFLKSDIPFDYRHPTRVVINVPSISERIDYYQPRSLRAPWEGRSRKLIMLMVAHDIVKFLNENGDTVYERVHVLKGSSRYLSQPYSIVPTEKQIMQALFNLD